MFDTRAEFLAAASALPEQVLTARVRSVAEPYPAPVGRTTTELVYRRSPTPTGLFGEQSVGGVYWVPQYNRDPVEAGQFGTVGDASSTQFAINFEGTASAGSNVVTLLTTTTSSASLVGARVGSDALGVVAGTTVVAASTTTLTLSNPVGAGGTGSLTVLGGALTGTDNAAALQAAVDFALQNQLQTVHIPVGKYRIDDTIHLGWGNPFYEISLEGAGRPAFTGYFPGTSLIASKPDRCAINIQGARMSGVRGLAVVGPNQLWATYAQGSGYTTSPVRDAWLEPILRASGNSPGGVQREAPLAGICIDAFSGTQPAAHYPDLAFPSWTGVTAQYGAAPSSDITLEQLDIEGFGVGILSHPVVLNGDGNGDFIRVRDSDLIANVYGVAIGNTQSRNVELRNLNYAFLHTFMTGTEFGAGRGEFNGTLSNISGGASYQLLDFNGTAFAGPLVFTNFYAEGQVRIGRFKSTSAFPPVLHFVGGLIDLNDNQTRQVPSAYLEGASTHLVLDGTELLTSARLANLVVGAGASVELEGADIIGRNYPTPAPVPTLAQKKAFNYTSGLFAGSARSNSSGVNHAHASATVGSWLDPTDVQGSRRLDDLMEGSPGTRTEMHQYARHFKDQNGREWSMGVPQDFLIDMTTGEASAVSLAGDQLSFQYTMARQAQAASEIHPGDLLYHQDTGALFIVDQVTPGTTNAAIVATQQNAMRTDGSGGFVSNDLDVSAIASGYLILVVTGTVLPGELQYGTFQAGSSVVTNIQRGDGYTSPALLNADFQEGDVFHASEFLSQASWNPWPFQEGTRIAAGGLPASGTSGPYSVTLTQPALQSGVFPLFPYPLN